MLAGMKTTPSFSMDEIRHWPAMVDLVRAARVFGIGRTLAYEMAQDGTFPVRVVKVGRGQGRWGVPTEEIIALLRAREQEGEKA